MKYTSLYAKITLLEPVIIGAGTSAEQMIPTLDYIPGSILMGIAANRLYQNNDPDVYDLVHSNKVVYGSAFVMIIENTLSYPTPLTWLEKKKKSQTVSDLLEERVNVIIEDLDPNSQYKPVSQNYTNGTQVADLSNYKKTVLKSAYDDELRRTEEGQLFGMEFIDSGIAFISEIWCEEGLADKVKKVLEGPCFIGKSRSAQFGRAQIDFIPASEIQPEFSPSTDRQTIYFKTHTCLVDTDTQLPTFNIDLSQFGLEGAEIDYNRSRIETGTHVTRNAKRQSYNTQYNYIKQGSVIVFKDSKIRDKREIPIGIHNNEGFGQVIINAPFVSAKVPVASNLNGNDKLPVLPKTVRQPDSELIERLSALKFSADIERDIFRAVSSNFKAYEKSFKNVSASQWGQIRELAETCPVEKLREKVENFITDGKQSNLQWKECGEKLVAIMEEASQDKRVGYFNGFMIQLASIMSKEKRRSSTS